jgi:hypothetical protein
MYIIRYLIYLIYYICKSGICAILVDVDTRPCVRTQWLCIRRTPEDEPLRVLILNQSIKTFVALAAEHVKGLKILLDVIHATGCKQ